MLPDPNPRRGMIARHVIPLLLLSTLCTPSLAQDAGDELGSWLMYFGQNRIGARSSIHTEAQVRFWETAQNYNQLLIRVGYNWDINSQNMVTGGYAFINTEPFTNDGSESNEHRLWQQFIQRADAGRVDFEHRFRLEERWIKDNSGTEFEGRARYRFLLAINLGNPERSKSYISLYDEIFINLQGEHFDQNRLYGAYGYRVDQRSRFEVGFLWNSFPDEARGRLQFAYFFSAGNHR